MYVKKIPHCVYNENFDDRVVIRLRANVYHYLNIVIILAYVTQGGGKSYVSESVDIGEQHLV
jgi:hypothetical protein